MPFPMTLTTPAQGEQLEPIADFIVMAAREAGLSARAVYHVQTAVDEACANIIRHAYEFEGQGVIELRCECARGSLIITLVDHGKPFDPSTLTTPDINAGLEQRQEGGLGYYLMTRLMDEVHYQTLRHANVLRMTKKLNA